MAPKRADARASVRLPAAIENSPDAEAIRLLGEELRTAVAKAHNVSPETVSIEVVVDSAIARDGGPSKRPN